MKTNAYKNMVIRLVNSGMEFPKALVLVASAYALTEIEVSDLYYSIKGFN